MSAFAEGLDALAVVLRRAGLRWYVFGAQAAIAYGSTRVTKDVDVTVDLAATSVDDFIALLAAAGFSSRARDLGELARTSRVLPVVHARSGIPFDVVLAGPGLEEAFLERAVSLDIAGVRVPVAAPEDVIVMKILASRAIDRQDVVAILRARPVDTERVRAMLALLDDALEQGDLVPAFEAALAEAGRR